VKAFKHYLFSVNHSLSLSLECESCKASGAGVHVENFSCSGITHGIELIKYLVLMFFLR
jgi:hypothetical protein